jgi:diguanylate cyclase (GGDEF)-like protein
MSSQGLDSSAPAIDSDFKRSLLRSIALFRSVEPDTVSDLLSRCGRIDIERGATLLTPERPNQCVYIVLSGRLEVHIGSLESAKIADLYPGACAGEMSLIEDRDPSAYVVAAEESHLMVISHGLLWQMVDRSHQFAKNLLVVLSERVRNDNEFIANRLGILRQAEHNAVTDALTGLGNRHWMQETFERELARATYGHTSLCVMMIDVDQFKALNDQFGHVAGDRVLSAVADVLREHLRPTDLIARFGGDEFAVLMPSLQLPEATLAGERLREQVLATALPHPVKSVTISVGVTASNAGDDLDSLVQRADAAMYQAKTQGRNRVVARS